MNYRHLPAALAIVASLVGAVTLAVSLAGVIILIDSPQNLGDGRTFANALGDLDGDEDLDVFVTNSDHLSRVYINDGAGIIP